MYAYTYVYKFVHRSNIFVYVHVHVHVFIYVYIHTYEDTRIRTCIYVYYEYGSRVYRSIVWSMLEPYSIYSSHANTSGPVSTALAGSGLGPQRARAATPSIPRPCMGPARSWQVYT